MAEYGLPIFDMMMEQNLLLDNVFAFYMSMDLNIQSELLFGAYDTTKFVGDIHYHDVVDFLFWSLHLDDIKYNGVNLNICEGRYCLVTPDSGTSLITTPSWAIEIISSALPYVENCSDDF